MLLRIVLASTALVLVGILAFRATGAAKEKAAEGCCGMGMMVRAEGDSCPMLASNLAPGSSTMADTPASRPATAPSVYTCSMHPEVVSDKPGKCPKCGMNLILKKEKPKADQKSSVAGDGGSDQSASSGHTHNH